MSDEIASLGELIGEAALGEGERARLFAQVGRFEKTAAKLAFATERARQEKARQFQLLSKATDDRRAALSETKERLRQRTERLDHGLRIRRKPSKMSRYRWFLPHVLRDSAGITNS